MSAKNSRRRSEEEFALEGGADEFQELFPTTRLPRFVVDAPLRFLDETSPEEGEGSAKLSETKR